MIFDIANWLGQAVVTELIGGSESKGWYALKDSTLLRWKRGSDEIQEVPLQWPDYPLATESAMHGLIGNTLIAGGRKQNGYGASKIRFAEFDATTGQMVPGSEYENGTEKSLWGAACVTNQGGFVGVVYADVTPKTTIVLDVFYRKPPAPPMPGTAPPQWTYERRSFTTTFQSGLYDFLQVIQGPDGLIWVFIVRDSAGTVALLRYKPQMDSLEFVDENPNFIPRGLGQLSPSGESPRITAVSDPANERILLCYCGAPDQQFEYLQTHYANPFAGHWSITAVDMNKKTTLIGASTWWTSHAGHTMPTIVPRPDGVYFMLDCYEPTDNSEGWRVGKLVNGQFDVGLTLPRGALLGKSHDGWAFYLDRTAQPFATTYLVRLCCAPVMSIRKSGDHVIVNWEPFIPGDLLQEKVEGGEWQTPFVCVPPTALQISSSSKIFRVVQNVPVTA